MLLRAGLPFRRLLLLSLVSGLLGLGGAALGVGLSLGPVPLTPWVFGVTAGVFLYVALVDMVRGVGWCRETKGSRVGVEEREVFNPFASISHLPEGCWTTGLQASEKQTGAWERLGGRGGC